MTSPKPASPCEHGRQFEWHHQIDKSTAVYQKDAYPICPICNPSLEKSVSSCPIDAYNLPEHFKQIQENILRGYYGKGKGKNIRYLVMIVNQLAAQIRKSNEG